MTAIVCLAGGTLRRRGSRRQRIQEVDREVSRGPDRGADRARTGGLRSRDCSGCTKAPTARAATRRTPSACRRARRSGSASFELSRVACDSWPNADATITAQGQPVSDVRVRPAKRARNPRSRAGDLVMFIIKRGDRYGVRLLDPTVVRADELQGPALFSAQTAYRVEAKFVPYDTPKTGAGAERARA